MLDLDWQWLLIAAPVIFALGWAASRFDLRQWKRADREAPKAYFKGLNFLLNEQPDKAIDAFIEAVQHDPDTTELHFALGNLFRRRGEFERAVRVHQHLLQRGDLPRSERERAQHALANDFMKAGLFDRAEAAFQALEGTPFETEARLARLGLHERSRDWRPAIDVATMLEKAGTGSFAQRISHYWCELAAQADERGDGAQAAQALQRAREVAPGAARPLLMMAKRAQTAGESAQAMESYAELMRRNPDAFVLAAADLVPAAQGSGQVEAARTMLQHAQAREPSLDLLRALARLDDLPPGGSPEVRALLTAQPTLSAALEVLDVLATATPDPAAHAAVREAVARAARPLQRWRCAACGFEAQRYFWQCPGCLSWDSYPPQRVEEQ